MEQPQRGENVDPFDGAKPFDRLRATSSVEWPCLSMHGRKAPLRVNPEPFDRFKALIQGPEFIEGQAPAFMPGSHRGVEGLTFHMHAVECAETQT